MFSLVGKIFWTGMQKVTIAWALDITDFFFDEKVTHKNTAHVYSTFSSLLFYFAQILCAWMVATVRSETIGMAGGGWLFHSPQHLGNRANISRHPYPSYWMRCVHFSAMKPKSSLSKKISTRFLCFQIYFTQIYSRKTQLCFNLAS